MQKLLFLIFIITIPIHSVYAQNWTAATRLTHDPESSVAPDIAVSRFGRLHIVWRSTLPSEGAEHSFISEEYLDYGEIYYLQLDRSGDIVVGPMRVTTKNNSAGFHRPSIAVDANNAIHIVWDDFVDGTDGGFSEVYYAKLDDRGNTLVGPSIVLSNNSGVSALVIDQKRKLHLGWSSFYWGETRFYSDIYYSKLDESKVKTVMDKKITHTQSSIDPVMAVDSEDNIHMIYYNVDLDNRDNDIEYTKLDDAGQIRVNDIKFFGLRELTFEPYSIGVDPNNNLLIVFENQEQQFHSNIYFAKLDNNGNTIIDQTKITSFTEIAGSPKIAVDYGGNSHIVWQDRRDGNSEIYYLELKKNEPLNITNFRLTNDSGISSAPDIGVDENGNVHVVWSDNRDGNFEIYYKKMVPHKTSEIAPEISSEEAENKSDASTNSISPAIKIFLLIAFLALILLIVRFYTKDKIKKGG